LKTLPQNHVQIAVSDTGAGIPEEDQDRIFERFYISEKSRSRKYDGTGIGLSIVKHILMLHNGTIELDKTYKNGTRFIIELSEKFTT
jgi:two-component system phosphate regulon sensor histidine kinase PhoR